MDPEKLPERHGQRGALRCNCRPRPLSARPSATTPETEEVSNGETAMRIDPNVVHQGAGTFPTAEDESGGFDRFHEIPWCTPYGCMGRPVKSTVRRSFASDTLSEEQPLVRQAEMRLEADLKP